MARRKTQKTKKKNVLIPKWVFIIPLVASLGLVYALQYTAPPNADSEDLVHWVSIADSEKAFQEGKKPILYDFSAAWCGPCQILKSQVFRDPQLAAVINDYYIPVSVVDRQREDGSNKPEVMNLFVKYHVNLLPTLLVRLPNGQVQTATGFNGKQETAEFIKEGLLALHGEK